MNFSFFAAQLQQQEGRRVPCPRLPLSSLLTVLRDLQPGKAHKVAKMLLLVPRNPPQGCREIQGHLGHEKGPRQVLGIRTHWQRLSPGDGQLCWGFCICGAFLFNSSFFLGVFEFQKFVLALI